MSERPIILVGFVAALGKLAEFLPEQSLMVVLSETGEAILVAARPDRHEELARFPAIEGKTWNHPVIAHGRLYARNAEEMACYELTPSTTVAQSAGGE